MPLLNIEIPFEGQRELEVALAMLMVEDVLQMRWNRIPPLYSTGVRYQREGKGLESWQSAVKVLQRRVGDCEDLAVYRASELIRKGERARAFARRSPGVGWHILVRRADGRTEDPS